jgi:CubicO group peptidase (beta-lactamase class C family)
VLLASLAVAAGTLGLSPPDDGAREAATAAVFERVVRADEPGLAALVRQGGKTVFARGYGVRDLPSRARIDPATTFRLASMTKQFTAMAVMLLVRDGRLRYDTALTDVFPSFPAYGQGITIRHLLTHTSGLPDYEDLMAAAERKNGATWTADRQISDDEVLGLLRGETAGRFVPGTSWAYSNSGYVVLGLVVARISGQRFSDFLRDRIFTPLRMSHTLAYEKGHGDVERRALGYARDGAAFREHDQSPTSATLGDGGVYSSLEDLAKWDEALHGHDLVSPRAMRPALTPVTLADGSLPRWPPGTAGGDDLAPGQPVAYGFGWFLDPWRGRRRMWHHGETAGFRTVIERFPDDGLTVVILCNREDLDPRSLALEVAELWVR